MSSTIGLRNHTWARGSCVWQDTDEYTDEYTDDGLHLGASQILNLINAFALPTYPFSLFKPLDKSALVAYLHSSRLAEPKFLIRFCKISKSK